MDWERLKEKYPKATEKFLDWIDKYKDRVGWTNIFGNFTTKYHHIPLACQFGIFLQFLKEETHQQSVGIRNPEKSFDYYLKLLEKELTK